MRSWSKSLLLSTAAVLTVVVLGAGCPGSTPDPAGSDDTGCVELAGAIAEDTTLDQACYEVTQDLAVNAGVTLTIRPGVTLEFAAGTGLTVGPGATLVAVGTAVEPITLTGASATPGSWDGVYIYDFDDTDASEQNNVLSYVTIEYGGTSTGSDLLIAYDGGATIDNCTLRYSAGYGFKFTVDAIIGGFCGNAVTGNALGAGLLAAKHVQYLETSSTYTGNDNDIVKIDAADVPDAQTWPAIDVDYYVETTIGLHVTGDLTLSPGITLIFANNQERLDVPGTLNAVGTANEPITLTAAQPVAGGWGGLRMYNTSSTNNQLEYVTIHYGGGYYQADLELSGAGIAPTQVAVHNCTFTDSAKYGVFWIPEYVTVDGDLEGDNTFSNNALGNVGT